MRKVSRQSRHRFCPLPSKHEEQQCDPPPRRELVQWSSEAVSKMHFTYPQSVLQCPTRELQQAQAYHLASSGEVVWNVVNMAVEAQIAVKAWQDLRDHPHAGSRRMPGKFKLQPMVKSVVTQTHYCHFIGILRRNCGPRLRPRSHLTGGCLGQQR